MRRSEIAAITVWIIVLLVGVPTESPADWIMTGSLNIGRFYHTATLLPNGKVLIAGGTAASAAALSSAELYDPISGTFTTTGNLATARFQHTATLLPNGKVLIAGGNSLSAMALSSAELYDPGTNTFTPTGNMAVARLAHTATLIAGNRVLIVGGLGGTGFLASTETYDGVNGVFT